MASKPGSPTAQARTLNVLDIQERRRSPKRGKDDRAVEMERPAMAEENASAPTDNDPGSAAAQTQVDIIVLEGDPAPDAPIEIIVVETITLEASEDEASAPADNEGEGALAETLADMVVVLEGSGDDQASDGSTVLEIVLAEGIDTETNPPDAAEPAPDKRELAMGHVDSLDSQQIQGWVWHPATPDEPVDVEFLVGDTIVLTVTADRFRDDLLAAQAGNGRHGFLVENLPALLPQGAESVTVRRASDGLELPGSPISIARPESVTKVDEAIVTADSTTVEPPTSGEGAPEAEVPDSAEVQETVEEHEPAPSAVEVVQRRSVVHAPGEPLSIGNIDRIDYDEISGWAWDPEHPDESIDIEILDDGVVVLKVPADQFRPDLVDVGAGNGRHGFSVRNLVGVFPLSRHRVRVRRASDGRDLPESPAWISQPGLDYRATDFIDQVMFTAVHAATKPEDLAQPLSHLLRLLNDLINAREDLARALGSAPQITTAEFADGQLAGQARDLVEHLRYAFRPLYFEPSAEPVVSVIIPVHNKFSTTYDCMKSISEALPKRSFEIIIVDDCSDDETMLSAVLFAGAVRILRNVANLGFVLTCNAGAAVAKGKYLLFLNNDTLVKDGWLDELVETFEQVPNIGIAGSKLLFEDGKLQEAGGIIWRLGDGWNWGRGRDPTEPAFLSLRDADWVSGAALMIQSDMFRDLGGFDPIFAPGYYEDTDLAFRVRALGKRVVVQPASEVIHLEGVSSGTDTSGPGMKRYQVINHAKFYQRWKETLATHRFNGQQPELEAERQVRRRAYFIDDTVPTPDQDAGSNAAVEHMRALMELGYKVTFLPADNMARIDPYTANLQKLGVECQYYPNYWSVEEVFRKTANKPDLVYLHRYSNASKYATMVRRYFPDCRIVYSVCDLHFLRMERQAAIDPGTITPAQIAMQRRDEMTAMLNSDCVIVYSDAEARMLHSADPSLNVEVVRWTVRPRPTQLPFEERSGMAFVGGFGHAPNLDAVRQLVYDILPLLSHKLPDAKTYLIGSKMPDELTNLRMPGVVPVGFLPVLADVFHKLRLTVVPLRYGAGIKGKVLESFAHGLPCIMSEVAAEGLELPKDLTWLVARSPEEFAEKIIRVHTDEALNRKLSEAGLAYIERKYSPAVVKEALRIAVAG